MEYKNIILVRDIDTKNGRIDLVMFTNEDITNIEREVREIKRKWYEQENPYSLLEEIMMGLDEKFEIYYRHDIQEIYY